MSNAIKQSGAYLEIVSFHLGDQEFCIDIMAIREIRGWAPVTPMPHTPPYVLGLINLRGAVIPVIDMAGRLGMKMTEPSERSAIIVTDIGGKLVGLLVEQVSDMMTIRSEDLQPAPDIIPEEQRSFCRGIVALEKAWSASSTSIRLSPTNWRAKPRNPRHRHGNCGGETYGLPFSHVTCWL